MSRLSYTRIANPHVLTATDLNGNFEAIADIVSSQLNGDNIDVDAEVVASQLSVATLYADQWDVDELCQIELPSSDGSHSVVFVDANGNTLFNVSSDGTVTVGTP